IDSPPELMPRGPREPVWRLFVEAAELCGEERVPLSSVLAEMQRDLRQRYRAVQRPPAHRQEAECRAQSGAAVIELISDRRAATGEGEPLAGLGIVERNPR